MVFDEKFQLCRLQKYFSLRSGMLFRQTATTPIHFDCYLPTYFDGFRKVLFTFDNRRVLGELNQRLKLFLIGNSRPQLLVKECLKYNC